MFSLSSAKSFCSEEIAGELTSILSINYGIEFMLLGILQDKAASNDAAVHTLQIVYPNFMDITFFSYAR